MRCCSPRLAVLLAVLSCGLGCKDATKQNPQEDAAFIVLKQELRDAANAMVNDPEWESAAQSIVSGDIPRIRKEWLVPDPFRPGEDVRFTVRDKELYIASTGPDGVLDTAWRSRAWKPSGPSRLGDIYVRMYLDGERWAVAEPSEAEYYWQSVRGSIPAPQWR